MYILNSINKLMEYSTGLLVGYSFAFDDVVE